MTKLTQDKLFDFSIATLIVGMGSTGLSCARYLQTKDCAFALADSREQPPSLDNVLSTFQPLEIITGDFQFEVFKNYQQIIVSPGISVRSELFTALQAQGCMILGDIELFAQVVNKPVIAISGSNGKSTVTTLVEKIAQDCAVKAIAGGNLGTPALDLLSSNSDLYILELSSFQLETTHSLKTLSATVLNISEDHMDRYEDLDDYRRVKERLYHNTENAVVNADDKISLQKVLQAQANEQYTVKLFSEEQQNINGLNSYYLKNGEFLAIDNEVLIAGTELKLKGIYNYLNVLAALALLAPLQLDRQKQLIAIKAYHGLAHRCEWVDDIAGVAYFNDSKGTNTGAAIAAIDGFELAENKQQAQRHLILIAGGIGKDADFTQLGAVIAKKIKATVLIGSDADLIKDCALAAGAKNDSFYYAESMAIAVSKAAGMAKIGDVVLLSPACASFDMYQNYMQRGDDFKAQVRALKGGLQHVS